MRNSRPALAVLLAPLALAAPGHAAEPLPVTEVARGVFVHTGQVAESAAHNGGDIANIGFIVGTRAVAVVDTGGSLRVGEALRAAVRSVTALPVRHVILTHVHPDHVLGAAAFADAGAEVIGHRRLPAALAARGDFYLARAREALGAGAAGTRVIQPTRLVAETLDLDLGGRTLRISAHPTAHTDSDLSVMDDATGTLWLSDLLFREHVPVLDGSLKGWLALLDLLQRLPARRVVPGHGPVSQDWPAALAEQRRYLSGLADEVRATIAGGGTLEQAVDRVGASERTRWRLFDAFHRRNVTAAFVELEWE